jgi:hypothetical protein
MFGAAYHRPDGPPGELSVNDDALCSAVWFGLGAPRSPSPLHSSFMTSKAKSNAVLLSPGAQRRYSRTRFLALSASPNANAHAAAMAASCCPSLLGPLRFSFGAAASSSQSSAKASAASASASLTLAAIDASASLFARAASSRGRACALDWFVAVANAHFGDGQNGGADDNSSAPTTTWDATLFVNTLLSVTDMREFDAMNLFDALGMRHTIYIAESLTINVLTWTILCFLASHSLSQTQTDRVGYHFKASTWCCSFWPRIKTRNVVNLCTSTCLCTCPSVRLALISPA